MLNPLHPPAADTKPLCKSQQTPSKALRQTRRTWGHPTLHAGMIGRVGWSLPSFFMFGILIFAFRIGKQTSDHYPCDSTTAGYNQETEAGTS